MSKITSINVDSLIEHYKQKGGLTLIGLNDSQLVDVINPYGNSSIKELSAFFRSEGVVTTTLNAASSFFNKAEHAEAFIKANLTAEEIMLINSYSFVTSISKIVMDILKLKDFQMPNSMAKLFEKAFEIKGRDSSVTIGEMLQEEPIIITSIMANNVMREIANNPVKAVSDYKNRATNPSFDYTVDKLQDEKVLNSILDGLKRTYDTILNSTNGITYGMGFFLPKGLDIPGLREFGKYIEMYNNYYQRLCKELGIIYIDVSTLGSTTGKMNFHADPKKIKDAIIASMLEQTSYNRPLFKSVRPDDGCGLERLESIELDMVSDAREALIKNPNDPVCQNTHWEREKELLIIKKAEMATRNR